MYKIRKVEFTDHPILKNLKLDFCGSDGKAVDTVIFAGENGVGKSTILELLYGIASHTIETQVNYEVEINGNVRQVTYYWKNFVGRKPTLYVKDNTLLDTFVGSDAHRAKYAFSGIFSDVDINFHASEISNVTSSTLDSADKSRRSTNNLPTEIKQLIIDIQALDDADLAYAFRKAKEEKTSIENISYYERMPRFTRAFNRMFDGLTYSRIDNIAGKKAILFTKNGETIPIDKLSSGEKQIVYRGCFLLKDVNAMSGAFVFIDEPEISLHPTWQMKIMDYYKGIFSDSNGMQASQIFAVTHSPFIIHNENRGNDKIIVLTRDDKGDVIVKDKPEYFKCDSVEAVQDAFSLRAFSAEHPTVYLEGRTDEKYFKRACEVFGIAPPFRFKWIGYMDDKGQEANTGEKSLDNAYQFLVARNLPIRNICLKDCDTSCAQKEKNNVVIMSIQRYENSKGMKKGIENALVLDNIDLSPYYITKETIGDYGEKKDIQTFDKMACCEAICALDNQQLQEVFQNLRAVIERLTSVYNKE